jgi:hypothetical protein
MTIIAVYTWPGLVVLLVGTFVLAVRKGWRGRD